ncbi:Ribosome biogenesis regulatory-like protein [Cyphellophora attinorum]|uniref:Ribosome biogenesis regulatory protein n=1 Tax=Cyphellophora attinorum TaxID=1664694 RepID=A0A0N0NRZ7_9EURO|nr:Ribosome biogenesis regulatory-like protein [Phialophora attinorum]KPI45671.1 Ribosome biogenesis regulatory-like protein [Phialophora attinorum]
MPDTAMAEASTTLLSSQVSKPTPYTFTPSYLTTTDPNPLPATSQLLSLPRPDLESTLLQTARDGAQSLLTHLLTTPTVTITSTPSSLLMQLPPTPTGPLLPRRLPLPKPKPPTKWETFAKKKGIGKFGGSLKGGAALDERKKNLFYDEASGEWVKKWGYKGKNMQKEGEWLVELPDGDGKKGAQKNGGEEKSVRTEPKRERMERVRRQLRKERNNARRAAGR